jgi:hypothetical protein
MSFVAFPIPDGISPTRLFKLRLSELRLGNDEESNLSRVPSRPEFSRFISIMLPSPLHRIPVQLHGLLLLLSVHEGKVGKFKLFFQFSNVSASLCAVISTKAEERMRK